MSILKLDFVQGFMRCCNDGWLQGYHERNGGNMSYRMTDKDMEYAKSFFYKNPSPWTELGIQADNLKNEFF
ncbi:MAG: hypothetical protein HUJ63_05730, partial [Enterococcus sp.]|nr:hypothetical protein [Enterococcus sp.]